MPGAAHASREMKLAADSLQATAMAVDQATLAPLSFVRFCMDNGRECERAAEAGAVINLSEESFAALDRVNRDVNRRIRPVEKSDAAGYGIWAVNPPSGDCNDYAVSKRHELIRQGYPASALLLAVARTSWGEGHLLLIVRTDRGDLVLDNLAMSIRSWDQTDYTWIKRQSASDPMRWETVSPHDRAARIAASLQRARDLAKARAESLREARLAQAEARRQSNAGKQPGQAADEASTALLRGTLGFAAGPAGMSQFKLGSLPDSLNLEGRDQSHLAWSGLLQDGDNVSISARFRMLPIALMTGADWTHDRVPYSVAIASAVMAGSLNQ